MSARIKINLLGKKRIQAPFGIDALLEKAGIRTDDLASFKIPALKAVALIVGIYLAEYVPTSIYEAQLAELDQKLSAITQRVEVMQKELASKKEIRRQMDQLTREENEVQRQLAIIANLSKNRSNAFKTFDTLSLLLPQKVWLNRMEYVDGKLQLDGSSWEYFAINDFVKALNETVQFQAVTLRSINAELAGKPILGVPVAAQKIKNFQVELFLKDKI